MLFIMYLLFNKLVTKQIEVNTSCHGKIHVVLDELTNYDKYYKGSNYSYCYKLLPGDYMILASTKDPGVEEPFCIRVFSSQNIICRSVTVYFPANKNTQHLRNVYVWP